MNSKRIFFVGVGGQGNILATKLLGEAALAAGVPLNLSETHGMAQRGGVVESTALIGGAKSTIISDGEADVLVAFEPLEALRALRKANSDSLVIVSTAKVQPFTVAIGQGKYPDVDEALSLISKKVRRLVSLDAMELARQANNPLGVNMVLLGALAAAGDLPIDKEKFTDVIETKTKKSFIEANMKCFELGYEAAVQSN
ncbi:indolepyruvate oxidoreductase subunit beta [Dethiosulfatarculus sandiegensis]|uniref:Pyruvate ferredoxin oxidoreductase n=1 Tax=Dethiosulfatarculus sandiegensis TaxID=1429043 RepID=A0A0D2K2Q8_9BACT|nr:indolepyruvate oxidoreductase subunit beta [Dethiosulfatarculus sandiegensis]KIX15910.1 pyruvate ferredoxin oxidoreductase [Dethiosulfatarculus sandiegensis]